MFVRALAAALSGLALSSAAPVENVQTWPSSYFIPLDLVQRLDCAGGQGTGWRVDTDLIATAAHVAAAAPCTANGEPLVLVHREPGRDFAVFRAPSHSPDRMPIACETIGNGEEVFAVGYAFGRDFAVQHLRGTGSETGQESGAFAGLQLARGRIHPGMSGGPVLNGNGEVVAIVNASRSDGRDLALFLSLKDTYLCRS